MDLNKMKADAERVLGPAGYDALVSEYRASRVEVDTINREIKANREEQGRLAREHERLNERLMRSAAMRDAALKFLPEALKQKVTAELEPPQDRACGAYGPKHATCRRPSGHDGLHEGAISHAEDQALAVEAGGRCSALIRIERGASGATVACQRPRGHEGAHGHSLAIEWSGRSWRKLAGKYNGHDQWTLQPSSVDDERNAELILVYDGPGCGWAEFVDDHGPGHDLATAMGVVERRILKPGERAWRPPELRVTEAPEDVAP